MISGVSSFGFWVETVQHKCEGLVSINNLQDYDDFRLIEGEYCLVGLRSGRKFRMGDRVNIKVVAANLDKRQLDYEWVLPGAETRPALAVAGEEDGPAVAGNADLPVKTENRKGDLGFRGGDRNNRGNERNNRKDKDKKGGNRGQAGNRTNLNSDFDQRSGSRDRQKSKGDKAPYSGRPWSPDQAKAPKFAQDDELRHDHKKQGTDPHPIEDPVKPDRYKAEWDEFLSKQSPGDIVSDSGDQQEDSGTNRKPPALAKKAGAPVVEKTQSTAKPAAASKKAPALQPAQQAPALKAKALKAPASKTPASKYGTLPHNVPISNKRRLLLWFF